MILKFYTVIEKTTFKTASRIKKKHQLVLGDPVSNSFAEKMTVFFKTNNDNARHGVASFVQKRYFYKAIYSLLQNKMVSIY